MTTLAVGSLPALHGTWVLAPLVFTLVVVGALVALLLLHR